MKTWLLALAAGTWLGAQTPSPDALGALPGVAWADAKALATAPADWSRAQWGEAGLCAAAVLGTALLLDRTVDDGMGRSQTPGRTRLARDLAKPGGMAGLAVLGAGYAVTSLLDLDKPRSVFVDMGLSAVLAQAAILPVKVLAGRARPADGYGDHAFKPFSSRDGFPSGHAAQAFAMAAALSARSDRTWVSVASYGVAGLVGLSRLQTRDHFASDVLAGALVGIYAGRAVTGLDQARRAGKRVAVEVRPALGPGGAGFTVSARF